MNAALIIRAAVAANSKLGAQNVSELLTGSARQNPKRGAFIKLNVGDADVKALKGPAERRESELYLVRLPADVVREIEDRATSRIIRPDEVRAVEGS